ncbi:MAG TPA: diaminopimelate epimerase, partial [Solirubrobacteraceae bacterium]
MRFEKWQALGNDYLILERDELPFELSAARARRLCQGHFGVFADGVLLLSAPADERHVADLRIFNPDGSEAEKSGNGLRIFSRFLWDQGLVKHPTFTVETPGGHVKTVIKDG